MPTLETSTATPVLEAEGDIAEPRPNDLWTYPQLESDKPSSTEIVDSSSNGSNKVATEYRPQPRVTAPHLRVRPRTPIKTRVTMIQQWECIIHEVDSDVVVCELHDLSNPAAPTEVAEVYVAEFNLFDRPLLQEGAVFYWSIGHETSKTGQVRRFSELRVRRIPSLTSSRKKTIAERAKSLSGLFSS